MTVVPENPPPKLQDRSRAKSASATLKKTRRATSKSKADTNGYRASRLNATKYGILSTERVLPWEDPAQYDKLLASLNSEHRPVGPTETHLVDEIASVIWRKRRIILGEHAAFKATERKFKIESLEFINKIAKEGGSPDADYIEKSEQDIKSLGISPNNQAFNVVTAPTVALGTYAFNPGPLHLR